MVSKPRMVICSQGRCVVLEIMFKRIAVVGDVLDRIGLSAFFFSVNSANFPVAERARCHHFWDVLSPHVMQPIPRFFGAHTHCYVV